MDNELFKPGKRLKPAISGVVLEGIISGCNFTLVVNRPQVGDDF
jgi:ATP-binding cassette subfamily B protein